MTPDREFINEWCKAVTASGEMVTTDVLRFVEKWCPPDEVLKRLMASEIAALLDAARAAEREAIKVYVLGRRQTIEASLVAEVLSGNKFNEHAERIALVEIEGVEHLLQNIAAAIRIGKEGGG